ncbi:PLP-dependent aminotransferase family protein [Pseudomonas aegrilactucae]|uniref:PLP-dependent aminotransferase family protein n=1 Tax=Pseudomonas aegrilactucae TaxID=2854028 RepID=A0A9Q2XHA3_9PSED|nr:PLP-dependent aminotransferase family protein [Pseudomonas aegrilactucae]MBV6286716.1 PLP-dependent aminotransferase family protein [Pseudomonas aegrilactucae]
MPLPAIEFRPGTPKVQQIAEAWARAIEAGDLPAGSRLPPVRELTVQLGVSKFTVIEALDRLRARNLITSSQGRGHFVANRHAPRLPGAETDWLPQDLASVLRRSLLADSSSLRPGSGHLPPDWLDDASLRQALRTVARATRLRIAGYGAPAGYLPLRQTLQARLHSQGIAAPLEQIVTTSNTVQALDMLLRLLLRPGDCVLLDSPCYFNFHANLALHGARIVTLERGAEGLDLAHLEQLMVQHRPRLYLTTSVLHNPTGHSFSPGQAFSLLQLARQHDCHIIEDDLYADLHPQPPARLAALAGLEQVTYVSGFSKTFSANARASFVVAAPQLAAGLTHMKLMSGGITSELLEQVVGQLLADGSYDKHRKRLQLRLQEAAGRVEQRLRALGCEPLQAYAGGLFIWVRLPAGCDSEALARAGLARDMLLSPGSLFGPAPALLGCMRFNVAYSDDPQVWSVLAVLLDSTATRASAL